MKRINQIINEVKFKDRPKNLSKEFQVFGVYLAEALGDTKHYPLYMKLSKEYPRSTLEQALNFVKDAQNVRSKARLFMWQLKKLRETSIDRQNEQNSA